MTVPPPTSDDLAPVPDDATFDERFWRGYAVDVAGYPAEWVDRLIEQEGVAALIAELSPNLDD